MNAILARLAAIATFALVSGCHPSVKPLEPIQSVENGCRHGAPKGPGIQSIMASIADAPPVRTTESTKAVQRKYAKIGGVIAHWNDLSLYLPTAAKVDGDSEGYLHITEAALDNPAADAQSRVVLILMKTTRGTAWYKADAYDVQNPCIEGTRQN